MGQGHAQAYATPYTRSDASDGFLAGWMQVRTLLVPSAHCGYGGRSAVAADLTPGGAFLLDGSPTNSLPSLPYGLGQHS